MKKYQHLPILFFSLVLLLALMPLCAHAADPVAGIGSTMYDTVQAAVDAADNGDTVVLLADNISESVTIPARLSLTINMNYKAFRRISSANLINNGTLTLEGSGWIESVENHGNLLVQDSNMFNLLSNGSTVIEKCTVVDIRKRSGTLLIKNGIVGTLKDDAGTEIDISSVVDE